ncbi:MULTISPECIES: DNA polymerase III subunit delta [Brochothrix]|uniref:DNA polymerase III subunit delta n=1 Tax=Brochothrix thermosphacta TaxID=2756 RepID=A0A1D2KIY1_BROTH|nr:MULTISPECIES: DNA polymerase III subunit delta [Brochothrix]SLM90004.1 DNA polymerase III delta subunit [Brachybacterium faecium]ATF26710.1 DNA polymerase III subunit delta [Brochothrix thermosphacta]ATH86065.1 DNA polymerase III subunit delta [Brochothrix thermosphacta]MBR5526287.1 DNA polymerase III subunit delta [Brochothrix sp.]MPQ29250.1 DNA polymerase III subunit delta [Brochothrix thermosphacta]
MIKEWQTIERGEFSPVYLIIGTEAYIIQETLKRIEENALIADEAEFNYANFDLTETSIEVAIGEAESVPFWGDRKVVILQRPTFLTSEKDKVDHQIKGFENYLNEPVPFTILVIVAGVDKLDARKKISKLVQKNAVVIDATAPNEQSLLRWLSERATALNMDYEPAAMQELMVLTNFQLSVAIQELEKIALFVNGGLMTVQIVEDMVVRSLEQNVFQLTEKVVNKETGKALRIYQDLIKQKEEPIKILALLISQFRLMNQVKIMKKKGYSDPEMARTLKVHPYRAKLAAQSVRNIELIHLQTALAALAKADFELKTGRGLPGQKVEWFIFNWHA